MSTGFRGPLLHTRVGHPFNNLPLDLVGPAILNSWRGVVVGQGVPYLGPASHATAPSGNTVSDRDAGIRLASTSSSTTGGSVAPDNTGALVLTTGTTDEDQSSLQFLGCPFRYSTTRDLLAFMRVKVSTATTTDAVLGLFATDTTLTSASAIAVDDGIGFFKAATATDLTAHVRKNTTSTTASAGLTIASDTYFVCGVTVINGAIRWYAAADTGDSIVLKDNLLGSGTSIAATNAPDDIDIFLTLSAGQEGGTTARTLTVDWAIAAQEV